MKLWAVWGYDDIYGGLHGMKEVEIYEGTEDEAMQYGYELADSVVYSYHQIYDTLEESVKEECEAEGIEMGINSDEEDDIRDEIYNSDMVYGCIELDLNKLPTLDIDELNRMFYNDEDGFIEAYRLD
jgi:hypothetical protein